MLAPPGRPGDLVLDFAVLGPWDRIVARRAGGEGSDEVEADVEPEVGEAVPDQLTRTLAGEPAAPVPAQQPLMGRRYEPARMSD